MEPTHQNTISTLEHLLVRANNAREAYRNAAKNVHNRPMTSFFEDGANLHDQFCENLKKEIQRLGGNPKDKTSLASDADRFWLDFASIIVRRNEVVILKSCAEAEAKAITEYDKLIRQNDLEESTQHMLSEQREQSQIMYDKIQELEKRYGSD